MLRLAAWHNNLLLCSYTATASSAFWHALVQLAAFCAPVCLNSACSAKPGEVARAALPRTWLVKTGADACASFLQVDEAAKPLLVIFHEDKFVSRTRFACSLGRHGVELVDREAVRLRLQAQVDAVGKLVIGAKTELKDAEKRAELDAELLQARYLVLFDAPLHACAAWGVACTVCMEAFWLTSEGIRKSE